MDSLSLLLCILDVDDDSDNLNVDILNNLDDDLVDFIETSNSYTNSPKLTVILLPSNLRKFNINIV